MYEVSDKISGPGGSKKAGGVSTACGVRTEQRDDIVPGIRVAFRIL